MRPKMTDYEGISTMNKDQTPTPDTQMRRSPSYEVLEPVTDVEHAVSSLLKDTELNGKSSSCSKFVSNNSTSVDVETLFMTKPEEMLKASSSRILHLFNHSFQNDTLKESEAVVTRGPGAESELTASRKQGKYAALRNFFQSMRHGPSTSPTSINASSCEHAGKSASGLNKSRLSAERGSQDFPLMNKQLSQVTLADRERDPA